MERDNNKWLGRQPIATLVEIYNLISGGNVKRFSDKKSGIRRILKTVDEDSEACRKFQRLLDIHKTEAVAIDVQEIIDDDGSEPLPTVGEVLEQAAETTAEELGTRTVAGTKLIVVCGKTIRPENKKKVLKGEALWGGLTNETPKSDKLRGVNQDINLNYPVKDHVAQMREGTGRYKLVTKMRANGVTVEDVMKMFKMDREKAIYKLRDLHYVGGHGLRTVKGRVYLIEHEDADA